MSETTEKAAVEDRIGEIRRLYARAFSEFGVMALWNLRAVESPTALDALAVARQLRIEGDMNARRLAEEIEKLSRADH